MALCASVHFAVHAETAVRAIFKDVQVQASRQSIRQRVFELMTTLLTHYGPQLKPIGDVFLDTVIRQIDGEKDPRCLLLVFRLVPHVTKLFSVDKCYEDLFEVVSCYFPITFNQPKNDPIGITQHDLLESLTLCLTSAPIFASLVLDLVFEKLGSGMDTAKLQGYDLLGYSSSIFGMKGYGTALSQIFTAVRTELFQSHDEPIKIAALNCLTAVTRMVSRSPAMQATSSDTNPLVAFLTPLVNESTRHLADFDVGLIRLHGRLLNATARGSEPACRHLCNTYLPELLSKATAKASVDHQGAYSSVANALLEAALSVNAVGAGSLMADHKDVVFAMLKELSVAADKGLRAAGFLGSSTLIATELLVPAEGVDRSCQLARREH